MNAWDLSLGPKSAQPDATTTCQLVSSTLAKTPQQQQQQQQTLLTRNTTVPSPLGISPILLSPIVSTSSSSSSSSSSSTQDGLPQTSSNNSTSCSPCSSSSSSGGYIDGHQRLKSDLATIRSPESSRQDHGDKRARKKDQNRRAASNYRRKKEEEKNRLREQEVRLVFARVFMVDYVQRLEQSIVRILECTCKTRRLLEHNGRLLMADCFTCPICMRACDTTNILRSHLTACHSSNHCERPNSDAGRLCTDRPHRRTPPPRADDVGPFTLPQNLSYLSARARLLVEVAEAAIGELISEPWDPS